MRSLPDILDTPIDWRAAASDPSLTAFLDDLQANILKGHGRKHAAHLFLSFAGMTPSAVAAVLRTLGNQVTSAHAQLRHNRRLPPFIDGGTVVCLFLGAGGYRALGHLARMPQGAAFAAGMAGRQAELADPPRSQWSKSGWAQGPSADAMVLIADASLARVDDALAAIEGWLAGTGARVVVVERGNQQHREFRPGVAEGVEHFGYVDGRSQPLFLKEALDEESQRVWTPRFEPRRFIVPDPNGGSAFSAGSFLVFRKLEQNVRGFKQAERELANLLFGADAPGEIRERAGAMVIGRFEDGTPIVQAATAQNGPPANDFNFDADTQGWLCPFHAHIRKTNPRGDVQREFLLDDEEGDRRPIMARRGMTYGADRPMTPGHAGFAEPEGQEPERDVGLLFMAYMASIEAQFEFTQKSWVNNETFLRSAVGIDPVIGQGGTMVDRRHTYLDGHSRDALPKSFAFGDFVTLLGGEYFFAPSISSLRRL